MENEFIYWKVKFDYGQDGFGYLRLNSNFEQVALLTEENKEITWGVSYTPIEFDNVTPTF